MPLNVVAVVEYCMAVGKGTLHLLFLHIRLLDSHLGGGGTRLDLALRLGTRLDLALRLGTRPDLTLRLGTRPDLTLRLGTRLWGRRVRLLGSEGEEILSVTDSLSS